MSEEQRVEFIRRMKALLEEFGAVVGSYETYNGEEEVDGEVFYFDARDWRVYIEEFL